MKQERDPWPLFILIVILILLWIYGCKQLSAGEKSRKRIQISLSKLREDKVQGPRRVSEVLSSFAPGLEQITIAWSNSQPCWTSIEGTTNFTNWMILGEVWAPVGDNALTLHHRPPYEFYRAFNSRF
jgi:hypothetical protein